MTAKHFLRRKQLILLLSLYSADNKKRLLHKNESCILFCSKSLRIIPVMLPSVYMHLHNLNIKYFTRCSEVRALSNN